MCWKPSERDWCAELGSPRHVFAICQAEGALPALHGYSVLKEYSWVWLTPWAASAKTVGLWGPDGMEGPPLSWGRCLRRAGPPRVRRRLSQAWEESVAWPGLGRPRPEPGLLCVAQLQRQGGTEKNIYSLLCMLLWGTRMPGFQGTSHNGIIIFRLFLKSWRYR